MRGKIAQNNKIVTQDGGEYMFSSLDVYEGAAEGDEVSFNVMGYKAIDIKKDGSSGENLESKVSKFTTSIKNSFEPKKEPVNSAKTSINSEKSNTNSQKTSKFDYKNLFASKSTNATNQPKKESKNKPEFTFIDEYKIDSDIYAKKVKKYGILSFLLPFILCFAIGIIYGVIVSSIMRINNIADTDQSINLLISLFADNLLIFCIGAIVFWIISICSFLMPFYYAIKSASIGASDYSLFRDLKIYIGTAIVLNLIIAANIYIMFFGFEQNLIDSALLILSLNIISIILSISSIIYSAKIYIRLSDITGVSLFKIAAFMSVISYILIFAFGENALNIKSIVGIGGLGFLISGLMIFIGYFRVKMIKKLA